VDPVAALANGRVGQANEHKTNLAARDVDLHFNDFGIEADYGAA
jgi:hypothetical protein